MVGCTLPRLGSDWNLGSSRLSLLSLLLSEVTQSCSTLCDPMDCSLPGSSVHGILQARVLEWVASPGDLPNPGIEPRSPALRADALPSEPPGKPILYIKSLLIPNSQSTFLLFPRPLGSHEPVLLSVNTLIWLQSLPTQTCLKKNSLGKGEKDRMYRKLLHLPLHFPKNLKLP